VLVAYVEFACETSASRVDPSVRDGRVRKQSPRHISPGQEAVTIHQALSAANLDRHRPDPARALTNLGITLWNLDRPAGALLAEQDAVAIRRELAATDPVPLEHSIAWLTCAFASGQGAVMVGWPGATQDRLPAGSPDAGWFTYGSKTLDKTTAPGPASSLAAEVRGDVRSFRAELSELRVRRSLGRELREVERQVLAEHDAEQS